jgi:hypothetical protein
MQSKVGSVTLAFRCLAEQIGRRRPESLDSPLDVFDNRLGPWLVLKSLFTKGKAELRFQQDTQ